MRFQKILVAIDRSEFAAHAVRVASDLATAVSGQIGLVHVIDVTLIGNEAGVPAAELRALQRRDGQGLLDAAASAMSAHPQPWKFLHEGTAWKEIIRSAREWPADVIVVGTHGRSGLRRFLLGSIAEGVVRHAPCPVMVVPPVMAAGDAG
jgi:nucleotide-binding universal stress UspA family protein